MFMPEMNRERWVAELLARLANYRPAAPLPGLLSEETWRLPVRAADRDMGNPPPVVLAQAEQDSDDDNILHDGVVNQFRERLDPEGLRFLKSGPGTPDEKRAYGQRVHPDAHLSAAMVPADLQRRFQDTGHYDRTRYFVGPAGTLHVRDASSREMLAQRLRRGMENAVAGGQRAKTPPIPPRIPLAKSAYEEFLRAEQDSRDLGLSMGANAMRHFRESGGQPIQYDHELFRSYPVVKSAEDRVNAHFVNWIQGTHPKKVSQKGRVAVHVDSGLNQIKDELLALKDGESIIRADHWDAKFPYSWARPKLDATIAPKSWISRDSDLYGMVGEAQLGGDGGFAFRRDKDRINFRGAVAYDFDENFDFEPDGRYFPVPAKGSIIPWWITQEEGLALQDSGLRKPYRTSSRWDRSVTGILRTNPDGTLTMENIDWGDPYRRPGRKSM